MPNTKYQIQPRIFILLNLYLFQEFQIVHIRPQLFLHNTSTPQQPNRSTINVGMRCNSSSRSVSCRYASAGLCSIILYTYITGFDNRARKRTVASYHCTGGVREGVSSPPPARTHTSGVAMRPPPRRPAGEQSEVTVNT